MYWGERNTHYYPEPNFDRPNYILTIYDEHSGKEVEREFDFVTTSSYICLEKGFVVKLTSGEFALVASNNPMESARTYEGLKVVTLNENFKKKCVRHIHLRDIVWHTINEEYRRNSKNEIILHRVCLLPSEYFVARGYKFTGRENARWKWALVALPLCILVSILYGASREFQAAIFATVYGLIGLWVYFVGSAVGRISHSVKPLQGYWYYRGRKHKQAHK